jgi:hypothetical protein
MRRHKKKCRKRPVEETIERDTAATKRQRVRLVPYSDSDSDSDSVVEGVAVMY